MLKMLFMLGNNEAIKCLNFMYGKSGLKYDLWSYGEYNKIWLNHVFFVSRTLFYFLTIRVEKIITTHCMSLKNYKY